MAAGNLEIRARALARHVLTNGVGNPAWHKRHVAAGVPADQMPKLLSKEEIDAEVDRDWPLYAKIITGEIEEELFGSAENEDAA